MKMLEDNRFPDHWRKLDTLMHVIGANEETTKRLLIELGHADRRISRNFGVWSNTIRLRRNSEEQHRVLFHFVRLHGRR
jgi:hypothetical protein